MTNDAKILAIRKFGAEKGVHSQVPNANGRIERRMLGKAAQKYMELLVASRARIVGKKNTDSAKEEEVGGGLREEIAKVGAPAGFTRTAAGLLIPVALAFALANAKCGTATTDDQDMDSTQDDAVTDVQPDETPDADADVSEDDTITPEDRVEQPDESVGPDADSDVEETDAEGVEETDGDLDEGSTEGTDVDEDGDVTDVPDETPTCDPIVRDETRPAESSGSICGIPEERIETVRITEYPEGCGIPRATSLQSVLLRILGALPADLTCARGSETGGLDSGIFLIVSLTPTELQMGGKIASGLGMTAGGVLDGGIYSLEIAGVSAVDVETILRGADGRVIDYGFDIPYPLGMADIDAVTSSMAWDADRPSETASLGMFRIPLIIVTDGRGIFYNGIGDEGWFTAFFSIDGAGADETIRFDRLE